MKGEFFRPCPKCGKICNAELDMCEICSGKIAKPEPPKPVIPVVAPVVEPIVEAVAPVVEEQVATEELIEEVATEGDAVEETTLEESQEETVASIVKEVKTSKTQKNNGRKGLYILAAVFILCFASMVAIGISEKQAISTEGVPSLPSKTTTTTTTTTEKEIEVETTVKTTTTTWQYNEYYTYDNSQYEDGYIDFEEPTENVAKKSAEYKKAVHEENQRHEQAIKDINNKYDPEIESAKYWINVSYEQGGSGSADYYRSQQDSVGAQLKDVYRQIAFLEMDTGGTNNSKIRQLESQAASLESQFAELDRKAFACEERERYEAELEQLEEEKQMAIDEENELYEINLDNLKYEYDMF